MSLADPTLPKQYKNSKTLYEQNLDAWRKATEQALATINLNFTQLAKDGFVTGYEFTNDGDNQNSASLEERINLLASGGIPISGTSADTFVINSDGTSALLSTSGLSVPRQYTFPDASGEFVITAGNQSIAGNKTFSGSSTFSGTVALTNDVTLTDGKKYGLGAASYLYTTAANEVSLVTNGVTAMHWNSAGVNIPTGKYFYFDAVGGVGVSCFFIHNAANDFRLSMGGVISMRWSNGSVAIPANNELYFDSVNGAGVGNYIVNDGANQISVYTNNTIALSVDASAVSVRAGRNFYVQQGQQVNLDAGATATYWSYNGTAVNLLVAGSSTLSITNAGITTYQSIVPAVNESLFLGSLASKYLVTYSLNVILGDAGTKFYVDDGVAPTMIKAAFAGTDLWKGDSSGFHTMTDFLPDTHLSHSLGNITAKFGGVYTQALIFGGASNGTRIGVDAEATPTIMTFLVGNSERMAVDATGLRVGGAAKWKLGAYTAGGFAGNGYVTIQIDGITYKLEAQL